MPTSCAPGDKALLFSDAGDAFLMYGRYGRSWIAFLEPLGNRAAAPELVWKFVELAREAGGRSAFYRRRPGCCRSVPTPASRRSSSARPRSSIWRAST